MRMPLNANQLRFCAIHNNILVNFHVIYWRTDRTIFLFNAIKTQQCVKYRKIRVWRFSENEAMGGSHKGEGGRAQTGGTADVKNRLAGYNKKTLL